VQLKRRIRSWWPTGREQEEAAARKRQREQEETAARKRQKEQEEAAARERARQQEEQERRRNSSQAELGVPQALEILGLNAGATKQEIRAAYNRLMKRVHPDVGGSSFFAKQLNEARDLLLLLLE
jgi:DnaJ-domain-containing protein 1